MASQKVNWHRELLEHPIPPHYNKLMIYCAVLSSILTIRADGNVDLHFNIIKGLNLLCICNLSSPDRTSRFLKKPFLYSRFHDQKIEVFFDPQSSSRTLLVVIRKKNELLSLCEESKIGFLKRYNFCIPRKTLKTYPILVREIYQKPNVLKAFFQNIHSSFTYGGHYVNKCLELRNCIKNCAHMCEPIKSLPSPYCYGMFVYANHLDWYYNYHQKNRCHERSGPIFGR